MLPPNFKEGELRINLDVSTLCHSGLFDLDFDLDQMPDGNVCTMKEALRCPVHIGDSVLKSGTVERTVFSCGNDANEASIFQLLFEDTKR